MTSKVSISITDYQRMKAAECLVIERMVTENYRDNLARLISLARLRVKLVAHRKKYKGFYKQKVENLLNQQTGETEQTFQSVQ
ncbi:hypothetical protein [Endozoicomonas ascidiicola]|uniref:hypothetical protein n=1 Tax=Endozoicomonas ascidiicola TaxID=1698521 RepID=UPI0012F91600|nr:hypothetical protein [Endozoicomonas ascidiicola]